MTVVITGIAVFAAGLHNEDRLKRKYLESDNAVRLETSDAPQDADTHDMSADGTVRVDNPYSSEGTASTIVIGDDITQTDPDRTEPVTLAFAGDLLLDPGYGVMAAMLSRGGGESGSLLKNSFDDQLLALMQDADIFMLNNEFPYSSGGSPTQGKQYTFRARPQDAALLHDIGVDIVSLANNHAYDYGEEALQSGCRTVRLDGTQKERVLEYMRSLSPHASIDDEGHIGR